MMTMMMMMMCRVSVAPVFTSLDAMMRSAVLAVSVGDSVRLRCDAVGRPRVQVQWFKDDKMLSASAPASPPAAASSSSSSLPPSFYDYPHPADGPPSRSIRY